MVNDSDLLYELTERYEKHNAFYKIIEDEHRSLSSDETIALESNWGELKRLLNSDSVLKLNLDSYSLPSQIRSGSYILAHGKLNSDGVLIVDAVDFYN